MGADKAIKQAMITQLQPSRMGFCIDSLKRLSQILKPGTKITITNDCVTGEIGHERFLFSNQPYELEADLEAFQRVSERRIAR
ncbi:MAG: hypothetical protein ACRBB6_04475 [Neptuniibacter sp.]